MVATGSQAGFGGTRGGEAGPGPAERVSLGGPAVALVAGGREDYADSLGELYR